MPLAHNVNYFLLIKKISINIPVHVHIHYNVAVVPESFDAPFVSNVYRVPTCGG